MTWQPRSFPLPAILLLSGSRGPWTEPTFPSAWSEHGTSSHSSEGFAHFVRPMCSVLTLSSLSHCNGCSLSQSERTGISECKLASCEQLIRGFPWTSIPCRSGNDALIMLIAGIVSRSLHVSARKWNLRRGTECGSGKRSRPASSHLITGSSSESSHVHPSRHGIDRAVAAKFFLYTSMAFFRVVLVFGSIVTRVIIFVNAFN